MSSNKTFSKWQRIQMLRRNETPRDLCLNHRGWVTHLCGRSAPCHLLNQCWNIINSNPRNKLQWNLKRNIYIFIHENVFKISSATCFGINILRHAFRAEILRYNSPQITSCAQVILLHRVGEIYTGSTTHCKVLQCQLRKTVLTHWACHFANGILKCHFSNGTLWFSIKISLQFIPVGPINNIPLLFR